MCRLTFVMLMLSSSPENGEDSFTSASKGQAGKVKQNGEHVQAQSLPAAQESGSEGQKMLKETVRIEGSQDDAPSYSGAGPSSRNDDSPESEHKVQVKFGGVVPLGVTFDHTS